MRLSHSDKFGQRKANVSASFDSQFTGLQPVNLLAQDIRHERMARHEPFDSRFTNLRLVNYSLRAFDVTWLAMSEPFGSPKARRDMARNERAVSR